MSTGGQTQVNNGEYFKSMKPLPLVDPTRSHALLIHFNPISSRIAASKDDGTLRIWSLVGSQPPVTIDPASNRALRTSASRIHDFTWKPDSEAVLYTVDGSHLVSVWSANRGSRTATIDTKVSNSHVACSKDGLFIASSSKRVVCIIDKSHHLVQSIDMGPSATISCICWANTAAFFFVGLTNGDIRVYHRSSPSDWALLQTLTGHNSPITTLQFCPRRDLVSGSSQGIISFWSLDEKNFLTVTQTIGDVDEQVVNVCVNKDATTIAVSYSLGKSDDGICKLYSVESSEVVHEIKAKALEFVSNKTSSFACVEDGRVILYEMDKNDQGMRRDVRKEERRKEERRDEVRRDPLTRRDDRKDGRRDDRKDERRDGRKDDRRDDRRERDGERRDGERRDGERRDGKRDGGRRFRRDGRR